MKRITHLFALMFFAISLLVAFPVFAANEPALVTQIVLDHHTHSLARWYEHQDSNYRSTFPWKEFWKKTCDLSHLECTDKKFRHLAKGTILTVPAPLLYVEVPQGVTPPTSLTLTPVEQGSNLLLVVPPSNVELREVVPAPLPPVNSGLVETKGMLLFFAAGIALLLFALVMLAKRLSVKERESVFMQERVFGLMERVKTIEFTMPPFAFYENNRTEVILEVVSVDGNGEPFVVTKWMRHPVKFSLLEEQLHDAFREGRVLPSITWKKKTTETEAPKLNGEDTLPQKLDVQTSCPVIPIDTPRSISVETPQ